MFGLLKESFFLTTIYDLYFSHHYTNIDSSCAVDHINYSLITPVSRQTQRDGYLDESMNQILGIQYSDKNCIFVMTGSNNLKGLTGLKLAFSLN